MYDKVDWPDGFHPSVSALYALNDIDVEAPPEVVWGLLTDAAAASRARRASAMAARPAGVSVTPRGSRRNNAVLASRSIAANWCETAGCDE